MNATEPRSGETGASPSMVTWHRSELEADSGRRTDRTRRSVWRHRLGLVVGVGAAAAFVVWVSTSVILEIRERERLDQVGVGARARVIATRTEDGHHFVTLLVRACYCHVTKEVTTLEGHSLGTDMAIRFDRADPSTLEVLEDQPSPFEPVAEWGAVLLWFAVLIGSVVLADRWKSWRRRMKAIAIGFRGSCTFDVWTWEPHDGPPRHRVALHWPQRVDGRELALWVGVGSTRALQGADTVETWGDVTNPSGAVALRAGGGWITAIGPHVWLPRSLGGPYMVAPKAGHELATSAFPRQQTSTAVVPALAVQSVESVHDALQVQWQNGIDMASRCPRAPVMVHVVPGRPPPSREDVARWVADTEALLERLPDQGAVAGFRAPWRLGEAVRRVPTVAGTPRCRQCWTLSYKLDRLTEILRREFP